MTTVTREERFEAVVEEMLRNHPESPATQMLVRIMEEQDSLALL